MNSPKSKVVRIIPKSDGKKALSADQKQFNSLTKKIDRQKQRLIEWKATIPLYRQKVEHDYDPLQAVLTKHKPKFSS